VMPCSFPKNNFIHGESQFSVYADLNKHANLLHVYLFMANKR